MGETLQVDHVLLPLRLVEPEVVPERCLELDRAVVALEARDRIAGQGAEQHEIERDRDEDREQRKERPLQDVVAALHGLVLSAPCPPPYFWCGLVNAL
jgi:hypothetical protein